MAARVRVIVQARMGSSRLPGKILAPLAGRPLLAHVVRRLQAAAQHDDATADRRWEITVATTTSPLDDATERLCRELNIGCFRGSEDDVLARYVAAAADLAADDAVVRATADNSAYCPKRAAMIVAEHASRESDYTCIEKLSYVVPEVMRVAALRRVSEQAGDAYCREHVTPYFRQPTNDFRVTQLPPTWQALQPGIRLTVDTAEELRRMERLFEAAGCDGLFSLERAYEVFHQANVGGAEPSLPVAAGVSRDNTSRAATA